MFRFEHINAFWGFSAILLLIILYLLHYYWRKQKLKLLGNHKVIRVILPNYSTRKGFFKKILSILGLIFIIIGIANPQLGGKEQEVKKKGIDIVIALDVSNSMLAEDIDPNRLERSKRAILQMINELENDRLCVIVFGGQSYVQLPLTTDYSAAKLFVNTINTHLIPSQGTAIGSAINLGVESLNLNAPTQKAIVIITDGENHEDNAVEAATSAAQKGIYVHTIGMGSEAGAPIPVYKGTLKIPNAYKKDQDGNPVTTRLNEAMLREIANAGNGIFVRASNAQSGLKEIVNELNKLEKTTFESKIFTDYESYFQYFIGLGILLIGIEFITTRKKSTLKLFNPQHD